MRALTIIAASLVTIMAKHAISRGIAASSEPLTQVISPASKLSAMTRPTAVDVIDRKKLENGFFTAGATRRTSAIVREDFNPYVFPPTICCASGFVRVCTLIRRCAFCTARFAPTIQSAPHILVRGKKLRGPCLATLYAQFSFHEADFTLSPKEIKEQFVV